MAWNYQRTLTIDPTKFGTGTLTDFPVGFAGTYPWLANVANGGNLQDGSAADIGFFTDIDLTVRLVHEVASYNAVTGAIEVYFKMPTLNSAGSNVVYFAYGNAAPPAPAAATGTWDAGFNGVFHFGSPTTLGLVSSTAGNFVGSQTSCVASTGVVASGGAVQIAVAASGFMTLATSANTGWTTQYPYAISFWFKLPDTSTGLKGLFGINNNSTGVNIRWDGSGKRIYCSVGATGSVNYLWSVPDTAWHHLVVTHNPGAPGSLLLYFDGVQVSSIGANGPSANAGTPQLNWYAYSSGQGREFGGQIDEFRHSTLIRSAQWIAGEYNNLKDPSTFYAVGAETPLGAVKRRSVSGGVSSSPGGAY